MFSNYVHSFADFFSTSAYQIRQKNSAGQIISIAILLLLCLKYEKKFYQVSKFIFIVIFAIALLITRCRSAMVGLIFSYCLWFIEVKNKKKYIILLLCIVLCIVFFSDQIILLISSALNLTKYKNFDLNEISSGRINLIIEAFHQYLAHPFIGLGSYYLDMFYINVIVELGILGCWLVFAIYFFRVKINLDNRRNYIVHAKSCVFNYKKFLVLASVFYLCVSLFEAAPPFGPGVACFLYWFLCGYYDKYTERNIYRSIEMVSNIDKKRS